MRKLTRHASWLGLAAAPLIGVAGCAPNFSEAKTPSGTYCTDMPVMLNGQPDPDKPFHRIKPISTPLKPLTAPERLEALRMEACKIGGDAVINAGDEEAQSPDHTVVTRASGYAIRWTINANKGVSIHSTVAPPPATTAPATEAEAPPAAEPPAAEPPPEKSAPPPAPPTRAAARKKSK